MDGQDGASTHNDTVATIQLHRGHVLRELSEHYKKHGINDMLKAEFLMPAGQREAAEDTRGVLRDVFTEFWEDFYEMSTLGEGIKVPAIRQEDWESCGKILVVGYLQAGYFPIHLARPFLDFVMYGEDALHADFPKEAFMEFTPAVEE